MNTYLINAPHEQQIATIENVDTRNILAYSNPAYYEPKSLARDFGDIVVLPRQLLWRRIFGWFGKPG